MSIRAIVRRASVRRPTVRRASVRRATVLAPLKYHCYLHNSDCNLTFHSIDSRLDSISNDTENSAC